MSARRIGIKPPWDSWYTSHRWRKLRRRHLDKHPLCVMCETENRTTIATICDHIEPHRGDPAKFWNPNNLQGLCQPHHDTTKQSIEKGGEGRKPKVAVGIDGWPA